MTQSLKKNWFVVLNMTSQNSKVWKFHFDGLFLSKVYKVWTKKYRGVIFHDPEPVVSKMAWGIGWTFIGALKSLKNCTLIGSFYPKHIMFQLETFRGIICHGAAKFQGKLTCGLKNDIRNLVNFCRQVPSGK